MVFKVYAIVLFLRSLFRRRSFVMVNAVIFISFKYKIPSIVWHVHDEFSCFRLFRSEEHNLYDLSFSLSCEAVILVVIFGLMNPTKEITKCLLSCYDVYMGENITAQLFTPSNSYAY